MQHPNTILHIDADKGHFRDARGQSHLLCDYQTREFTLDFHSDGSVEGQLGSHIVSLPPWVGSHIVSLAPWDGSVGDLQTTVQGVVAPHGEWLFLMSMAAQIPPGTTDDRWWNSTARLTVSGKEYWAAPLSTILHPLELGQLAGQLQAFRESRQRADEFPLGSRLPVDIGPYEKWQLELDRNGYEGEVRLVLNCLWRIPIA